VNADWFYSEGDKRQGPVTEDALRQLVADGRLKPADLVWKDGMADWVAARTVPTLFPAARAEPARDDEDRPSRRRFDEDRPSRRGRDEDDDRPSRRGRRFDEDAPDDDRPSVRRHEDDDDRYDEDRPRRRRRGVKPGQVQAIGIMMLIGGILGILYFLVLPLASSGFCCLWPGVYYEIVVGILILIRGVNMMNADDQGPPRTLAILQIICIVNGDIANCVMGIVSLVLLNDPKVEEYYRWRGFS
jgi:hypothetical protein